MISSLIGMKGSTLALALLGVTLLATAICVLVHVMRKRSKENRRITPSAHKERERDRWLGDGRK